MSAGDVKIDIYSTPEYKDALDSVLRDNELIAFAEWIDRFGFKQQVTEHWVSADKSAPRNQKGQQIKNTRELLQLFRARKNNRNA